MKKINNQFDKIIILEKLWHSKSELVSTVINYINVIFLIFLLNILVIKMN